MVDPDDDEDIDVEVRTPSLGFAVVLLIKNSVSSFYLTPQATTRFICFVDVVTIKVK